MRTRRLILLLLLAASLSPACRPRTPRSPAEQRGVRAFPFPEIPALYAGPAERQEYLTDHFWDAFLAGDGPCDSSAVLGVPRAEVEQQMSNYISLLEQIPLAQAQQKMRAFFRQVEERQVADTGSRVFLLMEEIVGHYLYDPNSPMRSEDLYLPYVEGLASSPCTREAARPGYAYQRAMCALAQTGSVAPDFRLTDLAGRTRRLHGIRAERVLLFFSNPGCHACGEIVRILQDIPGLDAMIAAGELAVVSVYIDEDIDKWRAYARDCPAGWICAYDPDALVRSDRIYNIRAIPSLYLLDRDKRILLKDAPAERVAAFLQNQQNR